MTTGLDDASVSECERDADQQVAWCAVAMAHRPRIIRGDDPTDGCRVERTVDRQPLPMPGELTIEVRKRDAGVHGRRHVAVSMDQQRVQLRCTDDHIDRCGSSAPSELRATAAKHGDLLVT